mmetsp:Transcript_15641/g.17389  ORF Transcript_15641/g.17389 Transcript_15641/m.17389 type:complete len:129 (-) Transcript_15641:1208-1594(-)|eukprot:CAMPEP_0115045502 /NCGR_PEP_ID=MMETSP0216-20121206/48187_1 /TAXON_ID=223996 /ORGANISM="Protocruzia adherens, Strain Boccale" /LENGTH=128 /DNA_ID=CAMNT_0002428395 /DNA_START=106 /DNA_END=492 /DNA_ORIENTATION=-
MFILRPKDNRKFFDWTRWKSVIENAAWFSVLYFGLKALSRIPTYPWYIRFLENYVLTGELTNSQMMTHELIRQREREHYDILSGMNKKTRKRAKKAMWARVKQERRFEKEGIRTMGKKLKRTLKKKPR